MLGSFNSGVQDVQCFYVTDDEWDNIDNIHELSQDSSTPFASIQKRSLSRSVSGNPRQNKRFNIPVKKSISLDEPPLPHSHKQFSLKDTKLQMPKKFGRSASISIKTGVTSSLNPRSKTPEIPDYNNMHA